MSSQVLSFPCVPRSLLCDRYGIQLRQLNRRRCHLGYIPNREDRLKLQEALDLEDYWCAINKDWGLGWKRWQFDHHILKVKDRESTYSLDAWMREFMSISRDDYMVSQGVTPLIQLLDRVPSARVIDVLAVSI